MYDSESVAGEPTLDDLLLEPIVGLMMRRDNVHAEEIRTIAEHAISRRSQATCSSSDKADIADDAASLSTELPALGLPE